MTDINTKLATKKPEHRLKQYQIGQPGAVIKPGRPREAKNRLTVAMLRRALRLDPVTGRKYKKKELLLMLSKRLQNSDAIMLRYLDYDIGKPVERSQAVQTVFVVPGAPQAGTQQSANTDNTITIEIPDTMSADNASDDVSGCNIESDDVR